MRESESPRFASASRHRAKPCGIARFSRPAGDGFGEVSAREDSVAVGGVECELVSEDDCLCIRKVQGISPDSRITEAGSAEIPVQIQSLGKEFPTNSNREYSEANTELQKQNRELTLPVPI